MKVIIILIVIIILLYYKDYIIFSFNINKYYDDTSIYLKNVKSYDKFITSYEGIFIIPINPILLKLYHSTYNDFKPILIEPINKYVTFTRLNISNSDRINCDWCSMANGLIYLIKKSIQFHLKYNPDKLKNISLFNIKILNCYISMSLLYRKKKNYDKNNKKNLLNNSKFYELFYEVNKLYNMLEQIELKWCPFRAYVDYYRNTNKNYLPINEESIYYAGEILSKFETIECHMCNKEINNKIDLKYIETNETNSPMKEFYEYVQKNN